MFHRIWWTFVFLQFQTHWKLDIAPFYCTKKNKICSFLEGEKMQVISIYLSVKSLLSPGWLQRNMHCFWQGHSETHAFWIWSLRVHNIRTTRVIKLKFGTLTCPFSEYSILKGHLNPFGGCQVTSFSNVCMNKNTLYKKPLHFSVKWEQQSIHSSNLRK